MVDELNKPLQVDVKLDNATAQFNALNTQLAGVLSALTAVDAKLNQNLKKMGQYVKAIDAPVRLNTQALRARLNNNPLSQQAQMAIISSQASQRLSKGQEAKAFNSYMKRDKSFDQASFSAAAKRGRMGVLGKALEARLARAEAENAGNLEKYIKDIEAYNAFRKAEAEKLRKQLQAERDAARATRKAEMDSIRAQQKAAQAATPQGQYRQVKERSLATRLATPKGLRALELAEEAKYARTTSSASGQDKINNLINSRKLYLTRPPENYGSMPKLNRVNTRLAEAELQRQALNQVLTSKQLNGDNAGELKAKKTLEALKLETDFLKEIIRLRQAESKIQNSTIQAQKEKNKQLEASQKLQSMNIGGLRSTSNLKMGNLKTTLDVDLKRLEIQKELSKVNKALSLAEQAKDSAAINQLKPLISLHQQELKLLKDLQKAEADRIRKREQAERDAARASTPRGRLQAIRDQELKTQLDSPSGSKVLTLAERARYSRTTGTASQQERINNMMVSNKLYQTKAPTSYATAPSRDQATTRLSQADVQRQALMATSSLAQVRGDAAGAAKAEKALTNLKQEIKFLNEVVRLHDAEAKAQNVVIQGQKEKNKQVEAEQKLRRSNIGGLRSTADTSIAGLKNPAEVDAKRLMIQKELAKASKLMATAEQANNTKAINQLKPIIELYNKELSAIKEVNRELHQHGQIINRVTQLTSSQGLGGLFAIQGLIAKNYALLNFFQNAIAGTYQFMLEFEKSLKQTQAISQATETQMVGLKESIIEVSNATRFSAIELSEASTTLAQAGFSLRDIQTTLSSVALLATATGSSLSETVDIATSVMGAFQMSATSLPTIVNQITQAMNLSKLDIQKFALATQYAGNAAADAGLSFEEMLASVAAVANTGVRSGSTLGTGFRQLLADMVDPSEKFQRVLKKLGLTQADVDVRTQGLVGSIENLREAGFSTADAYESFEVRAVAFYTALSNNLESYDELSMAMDNNTAATEANEVQMNSLAAQSDRAKNQLKILGDTAGGSVREALKDLFNLIADIASGLNSIAKNPIAAAIAKFAALTLVIRGFMFVGSLTIKTIFGLGLLMTNLRAGAAAAAVGVNAATVATTRFAFALKLLKAAQPWLLVISLAIAGLTMAFQKFGESSEETTKKLEEAKTSFNEIKDRIGVTGDAMAEVEVKIRSLNARMEALRDSPSEVATEFNKLQAKAIELGVNLETKLTGTVENLKTAWAELRAELAERMELDLTQFIAANELVQSMRSKKYSEDVTDTDSEAIAKGLNPFSRKKLNLESQQLQAMSGIAGARKSPNPTSMAKAINDEFGKYLAIAKGVSFDDPITQEFGKKLMEYQTFSTDPKNLYDPTEETLATNKRLMAELAAYITDINLVFSRALSDRKIPEKFRTEYTEKQESLYDIQNAPSTGLNARYNSINQVGVSKRQTSLNKVNAYSAQATTQMARMEQFKPLIVETAQRKGVDPALALAITKAESGFNPNARSPVGAEGLMQLMPATAKKDLKVQDSFDPKQNVEGGVKYISQLLDRYDGNVELALMAYNWGMGNVDNYLSRLKKGQTPKVPTETKDYVARVLKNKAQFEGKGAESFQLGKNKGDNFVTTYVNPNASKTDGLRGEIQGVKNTIEDLDNEIKALEAKGVKPDNEELLKLTGTRITMRNIVDTKTLELTQQLDADIKVAKTQIERDKLQVEIDLAKLTQDIQKVDVALQDAKAEDFLTVTQPMLDQKETLLRKQSELNLQNAKLGATVFTSGDPNGKINDKQLELATAKENASLNTQLANNQRERIRTEKAFNDYIANIYVERNKARLKELDDAMKAIEAERKLTDEMVKLNRQRTEQVEDVDLRKMQNQRSIMDNPLYRDRYSSIERETLDKDIEKRVAANNQVRDLADAQAMQQANQIELSKTNTLLDSTSLQEMDALSDMLIIGVATKENEADARYKSAVETYEALKAKVAELKTKAASLSGEALTIQNQIDANNPDAAPAEMGTWERIKLKYRKEYEEANTQDAQYSQASGMIDELTGKFRSFIDTTMDASEDLDEFFDRITSGSSEAKDAFKALGYDLLRTMRKVLFDKIASDFMGMLAGAVGDGTGTTTTRTVNDKHSGTRQVVGILGQIASAYFGGGMGGGGATQAAGTQASGATTYGLGSGWNTSNISVTPMAKGGWVQGGTPNKDSVPVMAMPDEYVLPKSSTDVLGHDYLETLRKNPEAAMSKGLQAPAPSAPAKPSLTNVYVVSPDSTPNTMGANDVVVAVQDNIQRNGTLKKLIKQVVHE